MSQSLLPEVWLRGPLPDVPALLQPVAHALLQAREDVTKLMADFPDALLWIRLGEGSVHAVASAGFHLQHLAGVLDRMLTYAQGQALTPAQLAYLASEGNPPATVSDLVHQFSLRVDQALRQLRNTDVETLSEIRGVGRTQLPSTVLGLLVHAAEHTQRHVGQLLVTARILQNQAT